ncbi:hypothetical protein [uncultured Pseudonocardia sp.]|uniref:cyanobactin maturation protease PatG family protein n=1 Tax=uncultured Pseudonocardia sp. TaxID=211455 RepID=UPI002625170F|nr:hypothetical protein [uncultured Pseudonocardia sp.]
MSEQPGSQVEPPTSPPAGPTGWPIPTSSLVTSGAAPATAADWGDNLVYALGQLVYDVPTRSRRASLQQRMSTPDPDDATSLLAHLDENPHESTSVHWILALDGTPLYYIEPTGAYAREAYEQLRGFLREQVEEGVERISLAGVIAGTAPHRSGIELPVVSPALSGMYSWTTDALVRSLTEATGDGSGKRDRGDEIQGAVGNFLERVYFELRNLGRAPQERAINFAATNALQAQQIFERTVLDGAELDAIEVEPSTIAPPGSNCWDVKLVFFYPDRVQQAARRAYRFTVDVADVVPATVGPMRSWSVR